MTEKSFLFAGGCPRSGTTVLAKVLNCHHKVRIGVERFNQHWAYETLTPELFETERFFDVREEDHRRWQSIAQQVPALREGHEDATYVGDKYPSLFKHYEMLVDRFSPLRIVYVVRNPFSVALSFQRRHDDPEDSFPHDGKRSLNIWQGSTRTTVEALKLGMPITVVSYERLFKSVANVNRLYSALDLDPEAVDSKALERTLASYAGKTNAPRPYSEELARHIAASARLKAYRTLIEDYCLFREDEAVDEASPKVVNA